MMDNKRTGEGYLPPGERGYQPTPGKSGGATQGGRTPLKDAEKPAPDPPPRKP